MQFESVIVNLLEKFLYYVTACQAADNYLVDIIEYCYTKITTYLINKKTKEAIINYKESRDNKETTDDLTEMEHEEREINFNIAMASLSIIRYITDHLEQLPFPITNYLLNSKDIPLLLVEVKEVS